MKKVILALTTLLMLAFGSCIKDSMKQSYVYYRPVYKTKQEVRAAINSSTPKSIVNPGKLFYKDGYVFLNDLEKGVHIIDVRNPASPQVVAFVAIPGSVDLAVRGNILYADLTTDLVAIDISNPLQVKLTKVLEGVFPHRYYNQFRADTTRIITEWVRVDTTVRNDEVVGWGMKAAEFSAMATAQADSRGVSNGTGGSMARFALASDRLYTVSYSDIKVFNTAVPENPGYVKTVDVGTWDIETIFPFGKNLFIGSMTGMYIFDIEDKDNPVQKGRFAHARVCDPVVSDGKYAYVTLRNGTQCGGFTNQLDVVNVENVSAPFLVKSYNMTNPHGLGVDGKWLLICDGADGLRILDASKADDVKRVGQLQGINTFDVIPLGGIALVSATDGLYLVDYSNPAAPIVKGSVTFAKK